MIGGFGNKLMAITKPIEQYEKRVLDFLKWEYAGLEWCEFGNQGYYKGCAAKKIYEKKGVKHISMDLNGLDGAMPIDLGQPISHNYINRFDVITNYGTIEHIDNQFEAFKNAHDMCKKDGIMIHAFPLVGNWPNHCRYYYSENFVKELVRICHYFIIEYSMFSSLLLQFSKVIVVTFKKKRNKFIDKKEFNQIKGMKIIK